MNTPWHPQYTITPQLARWLMEIEAARTVVEHTPLPPAIEAELRQRARVRATHYSTRIEGNRLTLEQAGQVIERKNIAIQGRERDVRQVRNYWDALLRVEDWAAQSKPFTQDLIRRLDPRARIVLGLFARQETITAAQVAAALGLSERMVRNLIQEWVKQGWLVASEASRRKRAYALSAIYRQFIGNPSVVP